MNSNGTRKENEKKAIKFMEQAVKEQADIIVLSELFMYWGEET